MSVSRRVPASEAPAEPGKVSPSPARPAELTVVIPTFNEVENVPILAERLAVVLAGIAWEAVFVDDDSPDGTAAEVRRLAQAHTTVRCLQRIGRRGLSSACVEGILSSSAPYVAIMDADLQHDETLLPRMLAEIKATGVDIVVASRYTEGGGLGNWTKGRIWVSSLATRFSRLIIKASLSDPMSGFFLIERAAFERSLRHLSKQGFKILVDIFASAPKPLSFVEVPFQFRQRLHGESKLDTLVVWEYLMLLMDKLVGHIVPVRFVLFGLIGTLGIGTQLLALYLANQALGISFAISQAIATFVAMTGNFWLNNVLTYRDRRLAGVRFLTGLLSFYAICAVGVVANVGIASRLFDSNHSWWISGIAGAAVGAVWNYAVSSVFTWRVKPK